MLNQIINVAELIFWILMLTLAILLFVDYLRNRSSERDKDYYSFSQESCIIGNLGDILEFINDTSEDIVKLDNPDLKHALEELNRAEANILTAMQVIGDLTYPVDE